MADESSSSPPAPPSAGDVGSLEALALLVGDDSHSGHSAFEEYVDTRFEDSFDVIRRSAIKGLQTDVLGDEDSVVGVVLNHNVASSSPANLTSPIPGLTDLLMSALGLMPATPTGVANVMVIGSPHTACLPVPLTYGETEEDKQIISYYPQFHYSTLKVPIIPGSFVRCRFDKGTYQRGVITGVEDSTTPYTLGGQVYSPLASQFSGSILSIEEFGIPTGPTPNADRLRLYLNELGPNIYEKGQELANGGDITAEVATVTASVMGTIAAEWPHIKIRLTGGNDAFHQGLVCVGGPYKKDGSGGRRRSGAAGKCYTSRHTKGNGIDFVVASGRGAGDIDLDRVVAILRRHVAGNANKFRFIDEYRFPTSAATAPHLHMSWGEGSEGALELKNYRANKASSPWNSPITVTV